MQQPTRTTRMWERYTAIPLILVVPVLAAAITLQLSDHSPSTVHHDAVVYRTVVSRSGQLPTIHDSQSHR